MTLKEACTIPKVLQAADLASEPELLSGGMLKQYKKGEHIFLDRDEVDSFYFIIDGIAALYKLNSSMEKKVIFIYGGGEMLNEVMLDDTLSSINCELLRDSIVLKYNRKQFLKIMSEDFKLSKAVMDSMALKIRRLYHQLKNTSNSTNLDKRIAAKLWKLSKDHGINSEYGTEINFDLPITYLADLVGSKRETVSRQVKKLVGENLISNRNNRFYVIDREKLLKYFNKA